LISAGALLRESGQCDKTVFRLDEAEGVLHLLQEAAHALSAGDDSRCRRIVELLAHSRVIV
jgi:hypothetical protein